jgi:methyl-accepting chemotaxis protein
LGHLIKNINQSKQYGFVDFAPYAPSNDGPASFIAQLLLKPDGQLALYVTGVYRTMTTKSKA